MTNPTERIVLATVTEKADTESGWKLTCTIPELKSQFPTYINRVPSEDANRIKLGVQYRFRLEQGRLKTKQDGTPAPTEFLSSYFWNWKGLVADEPTGAKQEPPPVGNGHASPQYRDADRIDWSDALKAAVEIGIAEGVPVNEQRIIGVARFFYANRPGTLLAQAQDMGAVVVNE